MSSPQYHEVLALARELNQNEKVKLVLEVSKIIGEILMNKKV